jgi:hypothetical protein
MPVRLLIDSSATGTASERFRRWPFETLPLSCDAVLLTPKEWDQLMLDPATTAMAKAQERDCRWFWLWDACAQEKNHG